MKYLKFTLLLFLCVFSFYMSDRILLIVEEASPLMQTINQVEDFDEYEPIDAKIEGNTIIPGKKGRVINKRETYLKMNDFGAFNETFYVYDYISPGVSIEDNLDKIIIKGLDDNKVSLVVDSNKYDDYLTKKKIVYSKIVDNEENVNNKNIEYINGCLDNNRFFDMNYYLKRNKIKSNICIIGKSNIKECMNNKYYLVDPTLNLYHNNVLTIKKSLEGGVIIYVHDDVLLSELEVIINEINYRNMSIVKLSELIKE